VAERSFIGWRTTRTDPAIGLEAVRKLVEQDKVFAIVGSLSDWSRPAVWEYLNKQSVPDILASAGTHMFGSDAEGHPWTVQMIPSYRVEATFFGQYISLRSAHNAGFGPSLGVTFVDARSGCGGNKL